MIYIYVTFQSNMSSAIGSPLNSSSAKANFSFPKDSRFKSPQAKCYTSFGYYMIPGTFGKKKDDAAGRGFGSTTKSRFGYYADMRDTKRNFSVMDTEKTIRNTKQ